MLEKVWEITDTKESKLSYSGYLFQSSCLDFIESLFQIIYQIIDMFCSN